MAKTVTGTIENPPVRTTSKRAEADAKASEREGELILTGGLKAKERHVPFSELSVTDWNPRIVLTGIENLSKSIKETGLNEPLAVATVKGQGTKLKILRGHRRFAALTNLAASKDTGKLDLAKIPVRDYGELDTKTFQRMMIDHNQVPLTGELEQAKAITILRLSGMSQDEIARFLNFSRAKVQYLLGVGSLPNYVLAEMKEARIARDAGKKAIEHPDVPVFDQPTVQKLVVAWNAKIGKGRKDEKDEDFVDFDTLWDQWKADKGRTLTAAHAQNLKDIRSRQEVLNMLAQFEGKGKPGVKDPVIAVLRWMLKQDGSEAAISNMLDLA